MPARKHERRAETLPRVAVTELAPPERQVAQGLTRHLDRWQQLDRAEKQGQYATECDRGEEPEWFGRSAEQCPAGAQRNELIGEDGRLRKTGQQLDRQHDAEPGSG